MISGLVQQPDKIVVRFAHTIYPYSLGKEAFYDSLHDVVKTYQQQTNIEAN